MTKVEYKTKGSVSGVFLLDQPSLEELDDIVVERLKNLRKLRSQEIARMKVQMSAPTREYLFLCQR